MNWIPFSWFWWQKYSVDGREWKRERAKGCSNPSKSFKLGMKDWLHICLDIGREYPFFTQKTNIPSSLSHTHKHTHSHTHTHTDTHTLSLTPTHTHNTHTLYLTQTHTHTHTHSLSHNLIPLTSLLFADYIM